MGISTIRRSTIRLLKLITITAITAIFAVFFVACYAGSAFADSAVQNIRTVGASVTTGSVSISSTGNISVELPPPLL